MEKHIKVIGHKSDASAALPYLLDLIISSHSRLCPIAIIFISIPEGMTESCYALYNTRQEHRTPEGCPQPITTKTKTSKKKKKPKKQTNKKAPSLIR